jgi:hypothetical protein
MKRGARDCKARLDGDREPPLRPRAQMLGFSGSLHTHDEPASPHASSSHCRVGLQRLSFAHSESSRHQNEKEDRAHVEAAHNEQEGRLMAGS